jgi:hypothetical protein
VRQHPEIIDCPGRQYENCTGKTGATGIPGRVKKVVAGVEDREERLAEGGGMDDAVTDPSLIP